VLVRLVPTFGPFGNALAVWSGSIDGTELQQLLADMGAGLK
jgi:hypothetical protein